MIYRIAKPDKTVTGEVTLGGSKSISNRVLIMEALAGVEVEKENLSASADTVRLQQLLSSSSKELDAGDSGTSFRFLTAYCALREGEWLLTGSERMQERPINDLVRALRKLGAEISYAGKEHFPPLKIKGGMLKGNKAFISSSISSQFISALLMIAPCLPEGLRIELLGEPVSEPYINMTVSIMKLFGIEVKHEGNVYTIAQQRYQPKNIFIESDWSAASYYYEMAALAKNANITLNGLLQQSFQGDAQAPRLMQSLGVKTTFGNQSITLTKSRAQDELRFNLKNFPDLAPAMFVAIGGIGRQARFTGLDHLQYKESNREEVLRDELIKCNILIDRCGNDITVSGRFSSPHSSFKTYNDHRIAMALAPLCLVAKEIRIADPHVVEKSYPEYWNHLKHLGFEITEVKK